MPEQSMICLTVIDLFVVIALAAVAVAVAAMIYSFIRDRFLW
jgi:hypothetical protein